MKPYDISYEPDYEKMHHWDLYSEGLGIEYLQCMDEGLVLPVGKEFFNSVAAMPRSAEKCRLANEIFEMIKHAELREDYKYNEPSTLEEIKKLRKPFEFSASNPERSKLRKKISGAWTGRVAGCMLGKTVEGIRTAELTEFLKETDNYPMHRFILSTDLNEERYAKYKFKFIERPYVDKVECAPQDDDTNYTIFGREIIKRYGKDFTPNDVAQFWLAIQPMRPYCTAERVAYINFINGFRPPVSAVYKNPYREWIGAQIRADYFGYINPGDPETAADMAFRDASVSHVKNGIYGEMFVAAMIAGAAVCDDIKTVVKIGLSQIPATSRLYEKIIEVLDMYDSGASLDEAYARVHGYFNESHGHGWCHTIPNAMLVVISLLYGEKDYGKTICLGVQTGFDTDCNAATAGSILGMMIGIDNIDKKWYSFANNRIKTSMLDLEDINIENFVDECMGFIE